jgi:hypothetical protein
MIGELAELQKLSSDDLGYLKKIAQKRNSSQKPDRKANHE